ncbi:MAG: zinc-ribbon domain-containing protein [Lachnospiraceae bacterium]|nr:zinc-ribbon domain-containing protein [Lachnospiraceae bacterium]
MICAHCNSNIPDEATFCPYCGEGVKTEIDYVNDDDGVDYQGNNLVTIDIRQKLTLGNIILDAIALIFLIDMFLCMIYILL